jgi:O-acetyl-ADP-ribose deacetylase (regulator of RNase III)
MAPSRSLLVGDPGQFIHRSPDNRLEIRLAIMSTFPAEAIVKATDYLMTINTANVPGASFQLSNAAGTDLLNHLHYKGLRVGDALASPSYELTNCYHIIYVNGPNYRTGTRRLVPLLKQQLADCYRRCLEEAFKLGVKSVAFPCISTASMLGWPRTEAATIGVRTVMAWLRHPIHGGPRKVVIERVYFLADPVGVQAHQVVCSF